MKTLSPTDADELLLRRGRQLRACDWRNNAAFRSADARTRNYRGERLLDEVRRVDIESMATLLDERARSLLDGDDVDIDPVRESRVRKYPSGFRPIHIGTYLGRCESNLLADVLLQTTRALRWPHVRAYVPGLREPAPNAILEIARGISHGQIRYWSKLDVRNFFPSIEHSMVESALTSLGYSAAVTRLVLHVIKRLIVRTNRYGQTEVTRNSRGLLMGMSESPVLANLICHELDRALHAHERIVRLRYADDILLAGRHSDTVTAAVKTVLRWARESNLSLKDCSPNTRAENLVHDVRNRRVPLLGAEVNHLGRIRLLLAKTSAKEDLLEQASDERTANGTNLFGRSTYDGGVGTTIRDFGDVEEMAVSYFRYWARLNPTEATAFLHRARVRHPIMPVRHSTVWCVFLGTDQTVATEEARNCDHSRPGRHDTHTIPSQARRPSRASVQDREASYSPPPWVTTEEERVGDPSARHNGARTSLGSAVGDAWFEELERSLYGEADRSIERGEDDWTTELEGLASNAACEDAEAGSTYEASEFTDHSNGRSQSGTDRSDETRRSNRQYSSPSNVVPTGWIVPPSYLGENRAHGWESSSPMLRRQLAIAIHGRSVLHDRDRITEVAIHFGPGAMHTTQFANARHEWALVRTIRGLLAECDGRAEVIIVTDPWLPKHLLSRHRRFRSPQLFAEVLDLHHEVRERRQRVFIAARSGPRPGGIQEHPSTAQV